MRRRADELRSTRGLKGAAKTARELEACLEAVDALEGVDRLVATELHRVVTDEAPHLAPKTWYGFPSYASGGEVVGVGVRERLRELVRRAAPAPG